MSTYDLAVIGAGPGGYTAAIRAAQLGKRVALIEHNEVGGVCLNRGCIPTKSLIACGNLYRRCAEANEMGLEIEGTLRMNFAAAQAHKQRVVETLRKGIHQLIKGNGIELIRGQARFVAANEIDVEGTKVNAENIVIATGSQWIALPGLTPNGDTIVTSDEALAWQELPRSVVIVGGGYIGCEFASLLNSMGVAVTIVEATDGLLPMVEKRISKLLAREYKKKGIAIFTDTTIETVEAQSDGIACTLSNGESCRAGRMLISVGRRAKADDLELERAGVDLGDRGEIPVNDRFQTAVPTIYAIGDVNGGVMLAHAAAEQGIVCAEDLFGTGMIYDPGYVPACIFSEPEVAYVGRTAEDLEREGVEFTTGRFPFVALGKALVEGTSTGEVIVHGTKEGHLLGVHAIGAGAVGIIAEATLALKNRLTVSDIAGTIHAHPTMSEAFAEAVLDVQKRAVHKTYQRRT